MNKKCLDCGLINFQTEEMCRRCGIELTSQSQLQSDSDVNANLNRAAFWFLKRFMSAVLIALFILCGFYFSLLQSAEPLSAEQYSRIQNAIKILEKGGFDREVFLLRNTVAFRSTDHWFNNATREENAYAATNFPFQIITLYDSFFTRPADEVEQAMILLHEAQHLQGAGEPAAYEFVWRNKKRLGWMRDKYAGTRVWQNVVEDTKHYAPNLFQCNFNQNADCIE